MHEPCSYSLDLVNSFNSKEEDCTKTFCCDLKEFATKIINCEEKDMIPLTDSENKFCNEKKNATNVKKSFAMINMKKRNLNYIKKLGIIVII